MEFAGNAAALGVLGAEKLEAQVARVLFCERAVMKLVDQPAVMFPDEISAFVGINSSR